MLTGVEAAAAATRRVAHPPRPCFAMGFLTGHELTWMPAALQILRDELPNVDVLISSQYSPQLANVLLEGKIDAAILRREKGVPGLTFRLLAKEPLVAILHAGHRLAARKKIAPLDLEGETFVGVSNTAPVLRALVDEYLKKSGVNVRRDHEVDHLAMAMSLIASTRGVALLPAYAKNFMPSVVTSRPLEGDPPTIDLVLGYRKSNNSPVLKLLVSQLDEWIERVSKKAD